MSAKAKSKATAKKSAPAPKAAKAAAPAAKKGAKAALAEKEILAAAPAEGAEDADNEEEEAAAASSSSGGGNAAALAAATTSGESASFKNFRHHPDMENFYRFIYENDLRLEALAIIDEMAVQKQARRAVKMAKAQAH